MKGRSAGEAKASEEELVKKTGAMSLEQSGAVNSSQKRGGNSNAKSKGKASEKSVDPTSSKAQKENHSDTPKSPKPTQPKSAKAKARPPSVNELPSEDSEEESAEEEELTEETQAPSTSVAEQKEADEAVSADTATVTKGRQRKAGGKHSKNKRHDGDDVPPDLTADATDLSAHEQEPSEPTEQVPFDKDDLSQFSVALASTTVSENSSDIKASFIFTMSF